MEIGDPEPKDATGEPARFILSSLDQANTKLPGEWNEYEITCVGQNYMVRINGELVTSWTDPKKRTVSGYVVCKLQ